MSYTEWPLRALAQTVLLKGMAFQQDFQAYLAHRHAREENVRLVHRWRELDLHFHLGASQLEA